MRTVRHRGTGRRETIRAFLLTLSVCLAMGALLRGGPALAAPCLNLLTAAAPPAEGYGAAFDPVGGTGALLVAGSECGGGVAKVAIGSGSADEYVFKTAYYRDGKGGGSCPSRAARSLAAPGTRPRRSAPCRWDPARGRSSAMSVSAGGKRGSAAAGTPLAASSAGRCS